MLTDALRQVIETAQDGVKTLLDDSITKVEKAIDGKTVEDVNTVIDGVVAAGDAIAGG